MTRSLDSLLRRSRINRNDTTTHTNSDERFPGCGMAGKLSPLKERENYCIHVRSCSSPASFTSPRSSNQGLCYLGDTGSTFFFFKALSWSTLSPMPRLTGKGGNLTPVLPTHPETFVVTNPETISLALCTSYAGFNFLMFFKFWVRVLLSQLPRPNLHSSCFSLLEWRMGVLKVKGYSINNYAPFSINGVFP